VSKGLPEGWIRAGKYFLDHVSGRWRVSKARVRDQWVYTLWKRIPKSREVDAHWGLYGNYDSVADAENIRKNPPPNRLNKRRAS